MSELVNLTRKTEKLQLEKLLGNFIVTHATPTKIAVNGKDRNSP